jgi:hypothetical protein
VGVKRIALATLDVRSMRPDECDLCKAGVEVVKPGSRKG